MISEGAAAYYGQTWTKLKTITHLPIKMWLQKLSARKGHVFEMLPNTYLKYGIISDESNDFWSMRDEILRDIPRQRSKSAVQRYLSTRTVLSDVLFPRVAQR